ncbi:hypothetical protein E2562_008476 [Oryza meyeriana var. granulata]|uniref:RRM domain-containing protein n=1 Tax=Oryza meyeriana var. granulata TaxID=110450 RepID=A0A6G1EJN9_9ORYZ|nr:hypothetical protein E2562_008476 [Oryza meyeriana var. granulata]
MNYLPPPLICRAEGSLAIAVTLAAAASSSQVNLPRGYGYVEFKKRADAEKALLYLDGDSSKENVESSQKTTATSPSQ